MGDTGWEGAKVGLVEPIAGWTANVHAYAARQDPTRIEIAVGVRKVRLGPRAQQGDDAGAAQRATGCGIRAGRERGVLLPRQLQ